MLFSQAMNLLTSVSTLTKVANADRVMSEAISQTGQCNSRMEQAEKLLESGRECLEKAFINPENPGGALFQLLLKYQFVLRNIDDYPEKTRTAIEKAKKEAFETFDQTARQLLEFAFATITMKTLPPLPKVPSIADNICHAVLTEIRQIIEANHPRFMDNLPPHW